MPRTLIKHMAIIIVLLKKFDREKWELNSRNKSRTARTCVRAYMPSSEQFDDVAMEDKTRVFVFVSWWKEVRKNESDQRLLNIRVFSFVTD